MTKNLLKLAIFLYKDRSFFQVEAMEFQLIGENL